MKTETNVGTSPILESTNFGSVQYITAGFILWKYLIMHLTIKPLPSGCIFLIYY